jgi:hypothetical protein
MQFASVTAPVRRRPELVKGLQAAWVGTGRHKENAGLDSQLILVYLLHCGISKWVGLT